MPGTLTTETPTWLADIQTASKAETRAEPWKTAMKEAGVQAEESGDRVNVELDPTATQGVVQ